jgi:CBS domain-containing protein
MDGPRNHGAPGAVPREACPRLDPAEPLARAAELLASSSLPLLPVVDRGGRLAGTLSRPDLDAFLRDASLGGATTEEALRLSTVEEAMDRRPVTALPGDSEEEAEALMERYALPALAVTDGEGAFLSLLRRRAPSPTSSSAGSPRRP